MTDQDVIRAKFDDFCHRFRFSSWNGPFFTGPKVTVASSHAAGTNASAHWVVWMEKPGVPNSLGTRPDDARIRATFRFSDVDAGVLTVEKLAQLMTGMVAGLEAHEVLEFARLDDTYAVDPHGTPAELHDIALLISEVIEAAPRVEGDTSELAPTLNPCPTSRTFELGGVGDDRHPLARGSSVYPVSSRPWNSSEPS
jgi:hypothetical protein